MTQRTIEFVSQELILKGTFTLPEGGGKGSGTGIPAAVLVAGSGQIDRDSNHKRMALRITKLLSDALADAGVATLRYDKRGVGDSQGDYYTAGFHHNVTDATAAHKWLIGQPEVDPAATFIIGHSEGALIAAELASSLDMLCGAVLLSGAAQTGEQVLRWQASTITRYLPRFPRLIIRLFRIDIAKSQSRRLDQLKKTTSDVVRIQLARVNARWFREFIAYDPRPILRAVQVPLLAITGSDDIQVDPADITIMRELAGAAIDAHVVQGMNHILRDGGASPATYRKQVSLPLNATMLELVCDWVAKS
jgi:uncharacterized protein